MGNDSARVKIYSPDKNYKQWYKNFQNMDIATPEILIKIGSQTTNRMKAVIKQSIKRAGSTGTLANSIDYKIIRMGKGYTKVGIGNTEVMSSVAPYWKIINYGGFGSRRVGGYFDEGQPPSSSSTGTGNWHHNVGGNMVGANNFWMNVQNPIKPMRYIERTVAWLRVSYRKLYAQYVSPEFRKMLGQ